MRHEKYTYSKNYNSFFDVRIDNVNLNENKKRKLTTLGFIDRAKNVHGDKFDYSKSKYVDWSTKIIVVCKIHNIEFMQTPTNHIHGPIGCPMCNKNIRPRIIRKKSIIVVNEKNVKINSTGEKLIEFWLNKNSIKYERQKTFNECKNRRKLRYDFYLPNQNVLIEYDGRQHFKSIECFGGENEFKSTQLNDRIKTEYAEKNNIKLLRIPYIKRKNLSNILKNNIITI